MLEKIGLPPKPSLRGNAWVVDSSHCQSCSTPFTFINRKHHCRRCGGLFCNSCTQQRMLLRGQGDSPVRICDPCKKLEEAARFEMRYGHKNRAGKGGSKLASEKEQDVLNQILGNEDKTMGSASSSSIRHMTTNAGDNTERNLSIDWSADASTYSESLTPDDLRQQAVLEKQKYKTLKTEGKSEEALRAFKRGKELERQAAALEISLRKSRKKASSSSNFDDLQQVKDDFKASAEKVKLPTQKGKEDHDLSSQLKELGWSDADLRDAEKRPATLTLEGELSSLLGEVSQKPEKKHVSTSHRSQVIAHKKKALELKRAGNLLEAKEELKKAKILERKIEEEELLGDADDSDDELSSLIRSMDAEGNDKYSSVNTIDANFDINKFVGTGDDLGGDGAFDVTDDDLEDPDMISALKSLGWNEDAVHAVDNVTNFKVTHDTGHKPSPKNKLSIQRELIALKKNVLNLRREGKIDESEAELEKAKILEQQLEDLNKASTVAQQNTETYATITSTALSKEDEEEVTDNDLQDPTYLSLLENLGWKDEVADNNSTSTSITMKEKASRILPSMLQGNVVPSNDSSNSVAPQSAVIVESVTYRKSKGEIQRELLTLKRKALTLRRQGNTEEADEILENAKVLEAQLQEYEDAAQRKVPSESGAGNILIDADSQQKNNNSSPGVDLIGNGTFQSGDQSKIRLDKHEPVVHEHDKSNVQEPFLSQAIIAEPQPMSVQQEILAHKRKALALKREGKLAEAKEELRLAKILEKHEEDTSQASQSTINSSEESVSKEPIPEKKEASPSVVSKPKSSHDRFKLQQESLRHKRQALKLRREGKTEEADAEFELAKALETQLQELDGHDSARSSQSDVEAGDVRVEDFLDPQLLAALQSVGMEDVRSKSQPVGMEDVRSKPSSDKSIGGNMDTSKSEIKQLEEQIKGEKVKAVNLKRAGRQAEALDALRRAKLYEKKLQSLTSK